MNTKTVTIERTFHLPLNTVWKAWSDPESLKKWWGPNDFTCPYCTIDFRVGGKHLECMKDKSGKENWTAGVYIEITEGKRIILTDSFSDSNGNPVKGEDIGMPGEWPEVILVTVEFQEHEGTTLFLLKQEGIPAEAYDDCILGWQECFDKLENNLR